MLLKDPHARPDAATCLEHPWFKKFDEVPPPLSVGVTQCLDAYASQPELKKAIFLLIAHQCMKPQLHELRLVFTHFDFTNRGCLSIANLREVLQKSGMSALKVEKVVYALDKDDSGTVEWTEFIAAALCISVCGEKRLVDMAFSFFDTKGHGKISINDIENVFAKGAVRDVWFANLPQECKKIGSTATFSKEQFQEYVGRRMRVTGGDQLSAVD